MCWLRAELVRTCSNIIYMFYVYIFRFVIVMIRLSFGSLLFVQLLLMFQIIL